MNTKKQCELNCKKAKFNLAILDWIDAFKDKLTKEQILSELPKTIAEYLDAYFEDEPK